MSTHKPHPTDWIQAKDGGGFTIPGSLEYIGPGDSYQAPKWSEAEYFGGDEEGEPLRGVYVVKAMDSGRLKIGFSSNVYKRVASLRTSSPERLELLCVLDTSEKYAHHLAREHRLHGEWFSPDALDVLANILRK